MQAIKHAAAHPTELADGCLAQAVLGLRQALRRGGFGGEKLRLQGAFADNPAMAIAADAGDCYRRGSCWYGQVETLRMRSKTGIAGELGGSVRVSAFFGTCTRAERHQAVGAHIGSHDQDQHVI